MKLDILYCAENKDGEAQQYPQISRFSLCHVRGSELALVMGEVYNV